MEHDVEIEVTLSDDEKPEDRKLITAPRVPRGGTVIWIFKGELAEQNLKVRRKGSFDLFDERPKPNQISGQPFPAGGTEDRFEYEIVDGEGNVLPWADGRNGGCMKPEEPP